VLTFRRVRFVNLAILLACMQSASWSGPAQEMHSLSVMPLPAHAVMGEGEFLIEGTFGVELKGYVEPRLERARQRFLDTLSRETGIPLWREAAINRGNFTVHTAGPGAPVQQLEEDESYHLSVSHSDVQLTAANPLGVMH